MKPRSHYIKKIIKDHFPNNKKASILDLGCGHGAFIYFAKKAGYENIFGVDNSPEQVSEAKRLGIGGIHQGDLIETLKSFPDESQDVVIAFDVIEHFHKNELLQFIDSVFRVLVSGGRFIIHSPNGESPFG